MGAETATDRRPLLSKLLNLLIVSILVTGAVVAVWDRQGVLSYIEGIPWLKIREVKIETAWPISRNEARQWLASTEGRSLLLLDTFELGRELESRTWVKAVTIRKIFPDGLWVSLQPKTPTALKTDKGRIWVLDDNGNEIARWSPSIALRSDLPVVSFTRNADRASWEMKYAVGILSFLDRALAPAFPLSEMVLDAYPYFRVFLQHPPLEVLFTAENWEAQLPYLMELLRNPPRQTGQIRVISLLSPKKAVVRPDLSH